MNQPFKWVEGVFEPGSWQLDSLFRWLVPRAAKRFVADKKRVDKMLNEKLAEEQELAAKSAKLEKNKAKFWARLRLRRHAEMAKDAVALKRGLNMHAVCAKLAPR